MKSQRISNPPLDISETFTQDKNSESRVSGLSQINNPYSALGCATVALSVSLRAMTDS